MTSPIGIARSVQDPASLIGLITLVIALPVGWGIFNRQRWAKWIIVCMFVAVVAVLMICGSPHGRAFSIGMQLLGLWAIVSLIRWDITGEVEQERRMELISEFLQQNAPQPVAQSSVSLQVSSIPPVTLESLKAAVESSFGRECKISSSNNNIDLGIEAACTTDETAVVGGVETDRFGHLIIGARPIAMEGVWSVVEDNDSPDELPTSVLTIETPRLTTTSVSNIDGYDWTIPLAAALWTSNTNSATVRNELLSFESAKELLEWKTTRLDSGN